MRFVTCDAANQFRTIRKYGITEKNIKKQNYLTKDTIIDVLEKKKQKDYSTVEIASHRFGVIYA